MPPHRVQQELSSHKCKRNRLDVWQRGVDTDQFNPRFRSKEMRARMTGGHPDAPLLIHVGRLGAEKNLFVLRDMLRKLPGAHLAFVGDGPSRADLEAHFADMPNVKFMVRSVPCSTAQCRPSARPQYSLLALLPLRIFFPVAFFPPRATTARWRRVCWKHNAARACRA